MKCSRCPNPARPNRKTCEACAAYFRAQNTPEQNRSKRRKRKAALAEWLREQKANPCTDCEHCHPHYVMDFHHIDPTTKAHNIAQMVRSGLSRERIATEIAKCVLLCANCHRIRTYG